MAAKIDYEPNDICVLRISGILKRSEFAVEQAALAGKIDVGAKPRLLVILEDFEGWERGADWNDLDFLISHSGELQRSPSSPSPDGKLSRLLLPGPEFVAHR